MSEELRRSSRERLLEAAKTLFSQRGYHSTTTAAIARQARTSESQLLKHFKDKRGLLAAVLEQGWRELNGAIRLAIARIASPVQQVKLMIDMFLSYLERDKKFRRVFLLEQDHIPEAVAGSSADEFTGILDESFQRMMLAGELRPDIHPQALTSGLMGAIKSMLRDQVLGSTAHRPLRYSESKVRLLFSTFLSSCLVRPSVATFDIMDPDLIEEQPWVNRYLDLADKMLQ